MMNKVMMLAVLLAAASCERGSGSKADAEQAAATAELQGESNRQVGMPGVTSFTEKRLVRQLYELRDQQDLSTYTYVVDFQGRLWHVCNSVGYGIPFSAQFSNPEVGRRYNGTPYTVPQPEPNGLWPPTSSSATWVVCASPDGEFEPLYVESSITVSPFRLNAYGSWVAEDEEPAAKVLPAASDSLAAGREAT